MPGARETRGSKHWKMIETGRSTKSKASFVGDASRIWNKAPIQITTAKTLSSVKKEIRKFCKTLPISSKNLQNVNKYHLYILCMCWHQPVQLAKKYMYSILFIFSHLEKYPLKRKWTFISFHFIENMELCLSMISFLW